jgi:glycosyltransferase involved in cell wall biosynthesis
MKILIHDWSGHPFTVKLSYELAKRGHEVTHCFAAFFQGPKGALKNTNYNLKTLDIQGIELDEPYEKYSYFKRYQQDKKYGKIVAKKIREIRPDVVISGNASLDVQAALQNECHELNIKFIFWVQDYISIAIRKFVKTPFVGTIASWYYDKLEAKLLRNSDAVILISEDFREETKRWNVPDKNIYVIPNWAPIDELPVVPKENQWSIRHNLDKTFNIIYSGTLGLKHNPQLLLDLAKYFKKHNEVRIVVISEGLGSDYLLDKKQKENLNNLILLKYQAFEELPNTLGTADILIAILEKEAGRFSVPSKVLSYLCTNRALLLSVPAENLSSRIVNTNNAGIVVDPEDTDAFIKAAEEMMHDKELRTTMAANGRRYAEQTFNIEKIADKFESNFL